MKTNLNETWEPKLDQTKTKRRAVWKEMLIPWGSHNKIQQKKIPRLFVMDKINNSLNLISINHPGDTNRSMFLTFNLCLAQYTIIQSHFSAPSVYARYIKIVCEGEGHALWFEKLICIINLLNKSILDLVRLSMHRYTRRPPCDKRRMRRLF